MRVLSPHNTQAKRQGGRGAPLSNSSSRCCCLSQHHKPNRSSLHMRLNMVLLDHTMNWVTVVVGWGGSRSEVLTVCVCYSRGSMRSPSPSLAPSLPLSHTHTVQLRRRRRWRRQRDSLLFSLRQKDLRPPCFCLDESATQRTPEAGPGTAEGSSKGKSQHSPSKQFLAGNNRLLSPLRAHLQCAANFTQSRAERGEGEGEEGRKKTTTTGCSGAGERALPCQARTERPLSAGCRRVGEGRKGGFGKRGRIFLIGLNPTP